MFVTVFVDSETFYNLVLKRKSFDAVLFAESGSSIGITVPLDKIYTTRDPEIVNVGARFN